ncbi:MAG: transcriptional regulatory protein RtcR [Phycisphaerales bacterium]|jgi:transcriptional regulatory protein RtcR
MIANPPAQAGVFTRPRVRRLAGSDRVAGKSRLAGRVYELRKHRHLVEGELVEVNCATLRGDSAMSALFGHKKGAFTGASSDRPGLLRAANHGILFLDEIGELGLDEQAMLLRAIEEKRFLPSPFSCLIRPRMHP